MAPKTADDHRPTNLGMLVSMGIPLCFILCFLILCYMKGPGVCSSMGGDEPDTCHHEALLTSDNISIPEPGAMGRKRSRFSDPLQPMI